MSKNLMSMMDLLSKNNLSYNESSKDLFKKSSKKFLKELAISLELREYKICFNPSGIAVSGDAILMGMWTEKVGIYININQFSRSPNFLYRTIESMKDYTGGRNQYIKSLNDIYKIVASIKQLRPKAVKEESVLLPVFSSTREGQLSFAV